MGRILTHEERVNKWLKDHMWWLPNFHKLSYMYFNGFVSEKTYKDLIYLKIRKFNGRLGTMNKVLEDHYSEK